MPSGNISYQEHESVRAYLQMLRHYVGIGTVDQFLAALHRTTSQDKRPLTVGELREMDGNKIKIHYIGHCLGFYDDVVAPYYGEREQFIQKYNCMLRACDLPLRYYGVEWIAMDYHCQTWKVAQAMAKCYLCGKSEDVMRCVCADCVKTIQPMSCAGCHYDGTDDLEEHSGHCARCIRNRYPRDLYEPRREALNET